MEEKTRMMEEYQPKIMDDDEEIYALKDAISRLPTIQRQIFLTYTELGTYAATAREYGVSVPTMKKYLAEIRKKIFENL